jgi:hypothetical protein
MAHAASLRAPTSRLGRRPLRKCTAHAASRGGVLAKYAASASTFSPVLVVSSSSAYSAAKAFTERGDRLQGTRIVRRHQRRKAELQIAGHPRLLPSPAVVRIGRRERKVVAQPPVDLTQCFIIDDVLRLAFDVIRMPDGLRDRDSLLRMKSRARCA